MSILIEYQLSLDESYNGNQLPFSLPIMYVNEHCRHKKCSMCNGKGAVFSTLDKFLSENSTIVKNNKNKSKKSSKTKKEQRRRRHQNTPCLSVHTASPCPICRGMGVLVDPSEQHCDGQLYHTINTPLVANIPRGARPGTIITLPEKGHERVSYIHNESRPIEDQHLDIVKTRGKVELKVATIFVDAYLREKEDRNATLSIESDHMEVVVRMSPAQAIYGFKTNISYINNRTLTIDRSGKITYPGSNSTVRGLGLPRVVVTGQQETETAGETEPEADGSHEDSSETKDQEKEQNQGLKLIYEDLIVKFKLIPYIGEQDNGYSTKEEWEEFQRVSLNCATNESYSGVGSGSFEGLGVNINGTTVIQPTGGENLVITGGSFVGGTGTGAGTDAGTGTDRLQQVANGKDELDSNGDSSSEEHERPECSEEDSHKFRQYEEDRKLRQLLRILTKRRAEEEEEEAARQQY